MNVSRYNIYIDASDNQSFIYNTLTTSLVLVDNKVRHYLEENNVKFIDPSQLASLEKCGIITNSNERAIYQISHNTAKYNTVVSSFLVFTTYACNLVCPYCYEGPSTAEYRSSSMSLETTDKVVDFICSQVLKDRSRAVGIVLYGGEPLLNMDCCSTLLQDVSRWCETNTIPFSATLMSNGTLLTRDMYYRIKKYLTYIHITLDGPQRFHDRTRMKRNGSGSYSDILQNLEQLKNTEEYLQIRINIDEENMQAVGEVLTDLERIGLKGRPHFYIYFSQIIPQRFCFTVSNPEFDEQSKKLSQYLPVITGMAQEKGWGPHLSADPGEKLASSEAVSCGYVKYGIYTIDPEGDVFVCPALTCNPLYKIGTIQNHSITWEPVYYDILTRDPTLRTPCNTCEFLPLCKGGCPVSSLPGDKALCSTRKRLYERLKTYLRVRYPEECGEVI